MERQKRGGAQGVEGLRRGGDRDDLVPAEGEGGRDRVPRLRGRDRDGRDRRARQGRQGGRRACKAGDEAAIVVNQTPFYGESGGQVGDRGRSSARKGGRCSASPTRRRRPAACSCIWARSRAGALKVGRRRSISRSITRAARRRAPTTRRRTSCTRRCARCSASTWRRRARSSRPIGCASTSRIPSR